MKSTQVPCTIIILIGPRAGRTKLRASSPMAQDLYTAFGLGGGNTTITSMDPDGVALAAIQELNQKLEARIEQKETEITELKARVEKPEQLLQLKRGAQ